MPAKYTLTYFPLQGRAEIARLLFVHAGVEFEDKIVTFEQWPALKADKSKFPLGFLPTLEVDGDVITQSHAINFFVAEEMGLLGESEKDRAVTNQVVETVTDYYKEYFESYYPKKGASDEEKKKAFDDLHNSDKVVLCFTFMENLLKKNNGGSSFFVGDKVSMADIVVYHTLSAIEGDFPSRFPLLKALAEKVAKSPNIKAYVASRKFAFLP